MNRREFMAGGAAAVLPAKTELYNSLAARICMFTDHLRGFEWSEVARMFKELGIAGPDLTLRPGGLVKPESVEQDLPKAAAVFKEHGLAIPMISTEITSVSGATARPILAAAAKLGIRYYKLGYFRYTDMEEWQATRESARKQLTALADLSRQFGIHAGFHNHSGPNVGGTVWDALELIGKLDPKWVGLYFDPSHATIEGGKNGWNFSFRRASSRLMMVAVKDYVWEKVKGEWRTRWVPLGEGMVRFPEFFKALVRISFPGPLSLHIEYDPGGQTKTERYDRALEAGARDLKFLREQLKAAFA